MLPVNYVGLALIIIGIGFMITEFFVVSGGVLGVGGLLAFVIGSVILFDDQYLAISLPLFGGIAVIAGGFLLWMLSRFAAFKPSAGRVTFTSMANTGLPIAPNPYEPGKRSGSRRCTT